MSPAQIKSELMLKGIRQSAIADALGVKSTVVGAVINRRTTSNRVAKGIAAAMNKPFEEVWGINYSSRKRNQLNSDALARVLLASAA